MFDEYMTMKELMEYMTEGCPNIYVVINNHEYLKSEKSYMEDYERGVYRLVGREVLFYNTVGDYIDELIGNFIGLVPIEGGTVVYRSL